MEVYDNHVKSCFHCPGSIYAMEVYDNHVQSLQTLLNNTTSQGGGGRGGGDGDGI